MISSFSKVGRSSKTSTKINPGVYKSRIKKVGWAEGYVVGSAVKLEYELNDAQGNVFNYSEIFFCNDFNERTAKFDEYLEMNNLKTFEDMMGFEEVVEILKVVKNNRSALSIVSRHPAKLTDEAPDGNKS